MSGRERMVVDFVQGDRTGLAVPAHAEALRAAGEEFLTQAFRKYGSLVPDNEVTRITRFELCRAGSTGQKVFLSVDYAYPQPELPNDLFVKFSRDFFDSFRDRRRGELESEIRLAELSRLPGFPISVPRPVFADCHHASETCLLITERIAFGTGGIQPLLPKCLDHELDQPIEYYRTILKALARLAAAHKSGLLSPQVEEYFPFDPIQAAAEDPYPWDEDQLRELITGYAEFAQSYPHLIPAHLTTPQFIGKFEKEAIRYLRHEAAIKRFLHANYDYIALSHFNSHIDNAWFWHDSSGTLQCGLFDWQRARQMNLAYCLWGSLNGAGLDIWDNHFDELLGEFIDELHIHGGPRLDLAELKLHVNLYGATVGLALRLIEAPRLVFSYLPEAVHAAGPTDPVFRKSEPARSFLHCFTVFLNMWHAHDVGASLDRMLERTAP